MPQETAAARAFGPFLFRNRKPPYTMPVLEGSRRDLKVVAVHCKTGLAAARRSMLIHSVTAMAAVAHHGKLTYSARWACGDVAVDAVIVDDSAAHRSAFCTRCAGAKLKGAAVYRFFDTTGRLLYVGSTGDVYTRFRRHAAEALWWSFAASNRVERFAAITEARAAEAVAIRTEHPLHNKLLRNAS